MYEPAASGPSPEGPDDDLPIAASREVRSVGVVLPALNEAGCLESLLARLHAVLNEVVSTHEVVVVDDGSDDDTAAIAVAAAERLPVRLIRHERNLGYGRAIRTGLRAAAERHDVVLTMDADATHDPRTIEAMLRRIRYGADVVIASRFCEGGAVIGVPWHRRCLSRTASMLAKNLMPTRGLRDFTSGYRAYHSAALLRLWAVDPTLPRDPGFAAGLELLLGLRDFGCRFAEVPLLLHYDEKLSTSKMTILRTARSCFGHLWVRMGRRRRARRCAPHGSRPSVAPFSEVRIIGTTTVLTDGAATMLGCLAAVPLVQAVSEAISVPTVTVREAAAIALGYSAAVVLTMAMRGSYAARPTWLGLRALRDTASGLSVAAAFFLSVVFVAGVAEGYALPMFAVIVVASAFVLFSRRLLWSHAWTRRVLEPRGKRILVYGATDAGRLLMKKIMQGRTTGTRVVGFLDDHLPVGSRIRLRSHAFVNDVRDLAVLGNLDDLDGVIRKHDVDQILVATSLSPDCTRELLERCGSLNVEFGLVPHLETFRPDELAVEAIAGVSIICRGSTDVGRLYLVGKRAMDLVISALLVPLAVPIILAVGLLIRLESPGPAFVGQTRVGRNGVPFRLRKLRTMFSDTDIYGRSPATTDDRRITRIGRYLRTTGIDELPQLANVLRGQMSLVGPRPEMPFIVEEYTEGERLRLLARPGITGLWQLSSDRSEEIHQNLEYDIYYLRNRDLAMDLMILAETALFAVGAIFRVTMRIVSSTVRTSASRFDLAPQVSSGGEDILVMLDQRCRPMEPPSWNRFLPVVGAISWEWPAAVVVAGRNDERFSELLTADRHKSTEMPVLRLLPHETSVIDAAMEQANLVITDLPHIESRAMERGLDLLTLNGTGHLYSTEPHDGANGGVGRYGDLVRRLEKHGIGVSVSHRSPPGR